MKTTTKVKNNQTNWHKKFRPRVGDVVLANGNFFQNTSGINSNPQIGPQKDWVYIGTLNTFRQSNLNIASKKPGNVGMKIEVGDIVYGMLDDASTFIAFGRYLGNLNGNGYQNINNYQVNPINF